jgi:poly-beta-1,6-N-acetyl-D-glucosamine biosynthesis protein PgaD
MVVQAGLEALLELVGFYGTVITLMGVTLTGWALYNQIRFRGKERRTLQPDIGVNEVTQFFAVDPALMTRLQQAKLINLTHDEQGRIAQIKTWRQSGNGPDTV